MAELTLEEKKQQYRERYLAMAKTAGVDEAVTALHREIGRLEPRVFDGGYEKDRLAFVQYLRELARDLYNLRLEEDSKSYYQEK